MRLLSDENLDGAILAGLFLHMPTIDLIRVQDVGLSGRSDPEILEWAAANGCVVSHMT